MGLRLVDTAAFNCGRGCFRPRLVQVKKMPDRTEYMP